MTFCGVAPCACLGVVAFLGLSAPASAAGEWGVTMTHANAYGLQASECPGGKAVSSANEPETDCGVDPSTGSGTTFARESGFNSYTIKVTNTGTTDLGAHGAGDTLTCSGSALQGDSLTYRWLRSGREIPGAMASSYKVGSEDEGDVLQCMVTASGPEASTAALSGGALVAPVSATAPPPAEAAEVIVSGSGRLGFTPTSTAQVGETVSCNTSGWAGSPAFYQFQWLREGVAIAGAKSGPTAETSFAYTLVAADAGKTLQCVVTATNAGGSTAAVDDVPGVVAALPAVPANIAVPEITGAGEAGETLRCEPGSWSGAPVFSYQWLRDGTPIPVASAPAYTLGAADEGKAVQCEAFGSGSEGASTAVSARDVVAPAPAEAPPVATEPPEAEGEAGVQVGKPAECRHGFAWEGEPATYEYQWLRDGLPIAGASSGPTEAFSVSYTPAPADAGKAIQCRVSASNAGGSVAAISRPLVPAPRLPPEQPSPEISTPSVTVADRLAPGLVLAGNTEQEESQTGNPEVTAKGWRCKVRSAGGAVECATSSTLTPGSSYEPITLHVHVGPQAGTRPANQATVSGGGAPPATSSHAEGETVVTPAEPFGLRTFTTSIADSLGSPFTQAGGHPFSASAELIFNAVPSDQEGKLVPAGGAPKQIEVELPPGFVGNPQNAPRCPLALLGSASGCPASTAVGYTELSLGGAIVAGHASPFAGSHVATSTSLIYDMEPAPGHPAQFGFVVASGLPFILDAQVRSDGDYGVTVGDSASGNGPKVLAARFTFCDNGASDVQAIGEAGKRELVSLACNPAPAGSRPFLTNPSRCSAAAPVTSLRANSWNEPASYVSQTVYNGTHLSGSGPSPAESFVTGCNLLQFNPEAEFTPAPASEGGTTQADEPTGASFSLKVPQTNEAGVNATPELKDATVTLPAGMTADPSAADGLQACSNAQFGLGSMAEPAEPAACPPSSQIGTARVITPLLEKPLEGQVFLGQPECGMGGACTNGDAEDGRVFRLFLQVRSPERGVVIKLAGKVTANPNTGQLQAVFRQQPQLPFSELLLRFTGGARAPLANPQTCGTFTTRTDLTPWSAPGLGGVSGTEPIAGTLDAAPSSSFNIDWNGAGGVCPGMPFSPSFSAGSDSAAAGASSPFSVTAGREDREQDISAITVSTPPGLLGKIAGIPPCPDAEANAGTCGAESQIGSATAGAGPGPHPFYLGGKVYLTGPYKGAPFGLSIVVPAIAGPFNLGTELVRASIAVNRTTAGLTIASDALPQFVDGVQLRLRRINAEVNRPGFVLNPTNCTQKQTTATISTSQGANAAVSSPFAVSGCQNLPFKPTFSASTQSNTSKANGASLVVNVAQKPGEANIATVDLQLPKAFPSRLTTLQKACPEAQFNTNPAGCPAGSDIGTARAITPVLSAPPPGRDSNLSGPVYLVSDGAAGFPDLELVLQGEGVEIVLDGKTDVKKGVTYARFDTVPDAPITVFETRLPEGPHSILTANLPAGAKRSLCRQSLSMPTVITGQNGKQIKQSTKIAITGCKPSKPQTRAQLLAKALEACKKKPRGKRASCARKARKSYGPKAKSKRTGRKAAGG